MAAAILRSHKAFGLCTMCPDAPLSIAKVQLDTSCTARTTLQLLVGGGPGAM
jgi:hypothetical protein